MMGEAKSNARLHRGLAGLVLIHALLLPISISTGQVWAYLVAVVALAGWLRGGFAGDSQTPLLWAVLLFGLVAAASVFVGVRAELALHKVDRLLLMAVPLVLPLLVCAKPDLARRIVRAFLIGCTGKGLYDVLRIPIQHVRASRAFERAMASGADGAVDAPSLFDLGNMRDPQFYAVAICLAAALWIMRSPGFSRRALAFALAINGAAILLHFKRGAWLALALSLLVMGLMSRRRRLVLAVLLAALAASQLPAVRARIALVHEEFELNTGGRYALWTHVAPSLYRDYPLGMGWRSVRHEDLVGHGVPVQKKLNHLHNNPMHIRLETGWPGLAAWLFLMGSGFALMGAAYRRARRENLEWQGPALGVFTGFLALHLNGLVEYNFGDGEIFMLMNLLLGLGAAGWVMLRPKPPSAA
ncbi:MAG TPA: O-antigen ligase family protein [Kiritimatiellia bacterium]|mgnify:CR=1 FL=1|nr:O-antigen ligase family protein [Kiritimatiellia bacterium]